MPLPKMWKIFLGIPAEQTDIFIQNVLTGNIKGKVPDFKYNPFLDEDLLSNEIGRNRKIFYGPITNINIGDRNDS